jgi:DNA-binding NarL/FixJ family response regulator
MPVRVALLDDNEHFRRQVVERLRFVAGVEVALDAGSAAEFFGRLRVLVPVPDVALVDIGLPAESGISVAERLTAEYPGIGVLMFTVFDEPDTVLASIQAGASGYLLKDATADEIGRAIVEVHEGGVPLSRSIARKVLGLMIRVPQPPESAEPAEATESGSLSSREVELLERIVHGETEAVIAGRLGISPHTVRTHVKNIYRKLRVRSRAAAVRLAYEKHLLHPPLGPTRTPST